MYVCGYVARYVLFCCVELLILLLVVWEIVLVHWYVVCIVSGSVVVLRCNVDDSCFVWLYV